MKPALHRRRPQPREGRAWQFHSQNLHGVLAGTPQYRSPQWMHTRGMSTRDAEKDRQHQGAERIRNNKETQGQRLLRARGQLSPPNTENMASSSPNHRKALTSTYQRPHMPLDHPCLPEKHHSHSAARSALVHHKGLACYALRQPRLRGAQHPKVERQIKSRIAGKQ